jgi:hypothetical protein
MIKIENIGHAIESLINCMPFPKQITEIDLDKKGCIYFTWRSSRYKLELDGGSVWVVKGDFLEGKDNSILIERLLELEEAKRF